jgi:predicted PurR-regulated permease PerM
MQISDARSDEATPLGRHTTALLIERVVAVAFFAVLLVGVVLVLRPFFTAFIFGGILVIATWPAHDWLLRKGLSNGWATVILSMIVFAAIIAPVVILAPEMTTRLVTLARQGQAFVETAPDLPGWLTGMPLVGVKIQHFWSTLVHGRIQEFLDPYSATLRKLVVDFGKSLADGALQFVLSLIVAAMFWLRGEILKNLFVEISARFGGTLGVDALNAAVASVRGVSYGIVGTAAAQAVILAIGLFIAGVPSAGFLGFLALIIALSQIGILLAVIWGGAAWWLYSSGEHGWAVFILVWGFAVSIIDNLIRPFLVGVGATLPLTLIFLGVFGGFFAFGFLGMFIGPTLLAVFFALLQAWRTNFAAQ